MYTKPPTNVHATKKTDAYCIDDNWSIDALELNECCPKKACRYISVAIVNSRKFRWTFPLKDKNAQERRLIRKYSYNFGKETELCLKLMLQKKV